MKSDLEPYETKEEGAMLHTWADAPRVKQEHCYITGMPGVLTPGR